MENKMRSESMKGMSNQKFTVMMLISFFIMYIVMFLNIDDASHYHTSLTRIYMALMMVAPMAVPMMGLMGKMYPSKKTNTGIMLAGVVVLIVALIGLRTQTPVGDVHYMKAMIPHHSSAIMVSKHAHIQAPEVKKLSEQIIQSQEKEISEMNQMIQRLSK